MKYITFDEALEILETAGENHDQVKTVATTLCDMLADCLAERFGVEVRPASWSSVAEGGLAFGVREAYPGQPEPEELKPYDPDGEFNA